MYFLNEITDSTMKGFIHSKENCELHPVVSTDRLGNAWQEWCRGDYVVQLKEYNRAFEISYTLGLSFSKVLAWLGKQFFISLYTALG